MNTSATQPNERTRASENNRRDKRHHQCKLIISCKIHQILLNIALTNLLFTAGLNQVPGHILVPANNQQQILLVPATNQQQILVPVQPQLTVAAMLGII